MICRTYAVYLSNHFKDIPFIFELRLLLCFVTFTGMKSILLIKHLTYYSTLYVTFLPLQTAAVPQAESIVGLGKVCDGATENANCCSNTIQDMLVWTAADCVTFWKQFVFSDSLLFRDLKCEEGISTHSIRLRY